VTPQFTPSEEFWPGLPYAANHRDLRPVSGGPPHFRGKWGSAGLAGHRHRFSQSEAYPGHPCQQTTILGESETFANVSTEAQTTVDPEGYTAIRVNLPPIGFNKARVSIEIDRPGPKLDLLDLEVPAGVVSDPGHGVHPLRREQSKGNLAARFGIARTASDTDSRNEKWKQSENPGNTLCSDTVDN
jgi:hypothetical protein